MAEDKDSSAEKSEEPTRKRLDKAREEGNTVRSRELNTMAILLSGSAGMILFGGAMMDNLLAVMSFNFSFERDLAFDEQAMLRHLGGSIFEGLRALLPLFGVLLVAALLGPIGLGGWNFTLKAAAPKASRLNPLSGLGRMFGPRSLVELAKAIAKILVVAAIGLLILALNQENILGIQYQATVPAMKHAATIVAWAVLGMSCAMIIITIVDIPFQIHEHTKKLKMTLQQVKDEMKETDGRPEVKQKIRQLQYQMAQNRMMADVPDADVVITNPTHFAVALRYDQLKEPAPVLLAKGGDAMAQRIREVAVENGVPVVESPALARAIFFNTSIGDEIPGGLYVAVAQVLAYIYQLGQYASGRAAKPALKKDLEIPDELKR